MDVLLVLKLPNFVVAKTVDTYKFFNCLQGCYFLFVSMAGWTCVLFWHMCP